MFTGIIEETGHITNIQKTATGYLDLEVELTALYNDLKIGDSVAVNGVCLTVTRINGALASFNIMAETVADTTQKELVKGAVVNLERAVTLNTRLGGHLVSGHIDTVGTIIGLESQTGNFILSIKFPEQFQKYAVAKGSIAVEGISLTIQDIDKNTLRCGIIPHTFQTTNLIQKKVGDQVNLEFDLIAKYVEKLSVRETSETMLNKYFLG